MARLLYVVTHSTEAPDRAATAIRAARAAAQAGHETALWLSGEGVRLGVKGVAETLREPWSADAASVLGALVEGGAVLHVSRPCFERREFEEGALRDGARLAEPRLLSDLLAEGFEAVPT